MTFIAQITNSPLLLTLIVSGAGVVLVSLFLLLIPSNVQERMNRFVEIQDAGTLGQKNGAREGQLTELRNRLNNVLSILSSDELRIRLASAHWQITDREYIFLRILITFLGFLIGWAIPQSLIGGIGMAIIAYFLPAFILDRMIDVRRQKFQNQLLDALVLIRGAVQSGYSLLQALDLVREELMPPSSEEFGRVVREVQLGLPLSQAMLNLSSRMENDDLYMVVTAVIINSQVGGNLSTMLTAVTNTIRQRIYLFGEVRALTAYARYAGYFLTFLPFATGLLIYLVNPTYFDKVPESLISQIILGIAFVMLVLGNIWIRKIVRIKV
jgi:tight adherence protein B